MLDARFIAACRDYLRSASIAIAVGVTVSCVYAIGHRGGWTEILVAGGFVGFLIYIVIAILEAIFTRRLSQASRGSALAGHVVLFLIGGITGWIFGVTIVSQFFGEPVSPIQLIRGEALSFIVITGVIAVVVGLLFQTFQTMSQRLRDREWAEKELELARSIQTRLLPPQSIDGEGFSIVARNIPAHVVAGDFYDFVRLDDGSIVIVVGDVAGKGMGAALIMASVKAVLPFVARGSVSDAMTMLNAKLVQELDRREFVALTCVRYFPSDGTLHIANAGCPDPYIVGSDGVHPIGVEGTRLPLGIRSDVTYTTTVTTLAPGSRLVMISDGIPEAPIRGDVLGYERFASLLRDVDDVDVLLRNVRAEVDEGIADDWTIVMLFRSAAAEPPLSYPDHKAVALPPHS
ncbi:MAG TPA: PP2C family protein-serine/threonine phosphatase [Thermoanaerobaculia bacterium]|nr:PP2C family protein-serine/threonine phosphatase [Thermoanaerobaculia bacterium]